MADKMSKINFALKAVPEYNGDTNKLNNFITCVNTVNNLLGTITPQLDDFEKSITFLSIKNKIVGKALDSIKDYELNNWLDLREHLKNSFKDKSNSVTILNELLKIQNVKNPYKLLDITKGKFLDFKSKLGLEQENADVKITIINYAESLIVNNFISTISDPYRNNLATRNPKSIEDIEQLLQNDFQYLKQTNSNFNKSPTPKLPNIPPQQFPRNNFPTGPIQFQGKNPTNQRFAPRQQLKNAQYMRPTPMSVQTRQTFEKQNLRPNNYFEKQNQQFGVHQPNYFTKELHNTENFDLNATNENDYENYDEYYSDQDNVQNLETSELTEESFETVADETHNSFLEFPPSVEKAPDITEK